jgi:hypothetical protein
MQPRLWAIFSSLNNYSYSFFLTAMRKIIEKEGNIEIDDMEKEGRIKN